MMMAKDMNDFGKMGQANFDGALKMWGDWAKSWQAVSVEMTDYAKRSFEDSSKTMERLMTARSIEQVMEIQSTYAKRAYDDYMAQMTRIGTMYADMAKETTRPFEALTQGRR